MKRLLPALLASALFLTPCRVLAEDPSALFLTAYQEFQAGEASERNGQLRDALNRYAATQEVLEQIRQSDPGWQSMVVEYRLRKAKEGVERLQAAIEQGGALPASAAPDPMPKKSFEIDIPAPKISTRVGPGSQSTPQGVAPSSASATDLGLVRELAEARAEIKRLRGEVTSVKAELSSSKMEVEKVKTEMVAAKSSLAQAEASLDSASRELETLRAKVDLPPDEKVLKLSSRIADLESENAFLKDDRERLTGKLRRASDYIRESESNLAKVLDDRKAVARERDKALARIQKLKDNDEEVATLRKENAALKKSLETSRAEFEAEFEKAKVELEKRLAAQSTDFERMAELQRINSELAIRLDKTEKALAVANEEKLGKARLDLLQSEMTEIQARLAALRGHIEGDESQTRLLFAQLEKTSSEITRLGLNPKPTPEQQSLIEEGQLLRGIILAKIGEQNDRLKSASELERRLIDLQTQSNELTAQIATLSEPVDEADASFAVVKKVEAPPAAPAGGDLPPVANATPSPAPASTPAPAVEPEPTPASTAEPARPVLAKRQDPVPPQPVEDSPPLPPSLADAERLMADGNAIEAEKIFRALVNASPEDTMLLTNLAIAQLELGRNTLATGTLKKVLEIKPGDVSALLNLANAQTRLGNVAEAASVLQEVLKNDPNNAVAYNYLGIALGKTRGRHLEAREAFAKSVALDGDFQNAHFNLAVAYARTAPTSLELARKHYEIAKKLGAAPDPSLEKMLGGIEPAP